LNYLTGGLNIHYFLGVTSLFLVINVIFILSHLRGGCLGVAWGLAGGCLGVPRGLSLGTPSQPPLNPLEMLSLDRRDGKQSAD